MKKQNWIFSLALSLLAIAPSLARADDIGAGSTNSLGAQTLDGDGEPDREVAPADRVTLLNKLNAYKGKIKGGTRKNLRDAIKAALPKASENTFYMGCDRLRPLLDSGERADILDCDFSIQVGGGLAEVNFEEDNSTPNSSKIIDVTYHHCDEKSVRYEDRSSGGVGYYCEKDGGPKPPLGVIVRPTHPMGVPVQPGNDHGMPPGAQGMPTLPKEK